MGEALNITKRGKWQEAMKSEMDNLRENGVFELVDRPRGKKLSNPSGYLGC